MQPQPPALTPQQAAIQQVRQRYEHGDLSFDRFEYALNALLHAQTPEQCQAILAELPSYPVTALDAPITVMPPAPPVAPRVPRSRWMVAIMGGVNRMRRPWRMGQRTQAIMLCGGMELDLNLAALPQEGVLRILAVCGGAKLYVPSSLDVTVRGGVMLGGVNVDGEGHGGILSFFDEGVSPVGPTTETPAHLEIQVFALLGGVEVVQTNGPVVMGGTATFPQTPLRSGPDYRAQRRLLHEERRAQRRIGRGW